VITADYFGSYRTERISGFFSCQLTVLLANVLTQENGLEEISLACCRLPTAAEFRPPFASRVLAERDFIHISIRVRGT
jgi:hypothetical protein